MKLLCHCTDRKARLVLYVHTRRRHIGPLRCGVSASRLGPEKEGNRSDGELALGEFFLGLANRDGGYVCCHMPRWCAARVRQPEPTAKPVGPSISNLSSVTSREGSPLDRYSGASCSENCGADKLVLAFR